MNFDRVIAGLKHTSIIIPEQERPVCQMCEATLKLRTHRIENPEIETDHSPNRSIMSWERDVAEYLPKAKAWATTDRNLFTVWCGEFQGWAHDADGVPLFCTYACGVRFAEIQYNAGHRVVVGGRLITRQSER